MHENPGYIYQILYIHFIYNLESGRVVEFSNWDCLHKARLRIPKDIDLLARPFFLWLTCYHYAHYPTTAGGF